jgi:methyl-accepting chemotaxis protein
MKLGLLRRLWAGSVARLYLIGVPLFLMSVAVYGIARDSLQHNSLPLVSALRLKESTVECLANVIRQDDASKALIINPNDPDAGPAKIKAYDRNQVVMEQMANMTTDAELRDLVKRMRQLDEQELRDLDTLLLEALGEGRTVEGLKLYQDRYVPARNRFEALVRQAGQRATVLAEQAAAGLEQQNANALQRLGGALLLGFLIVSATVVVLVRSLISSLRARLRAATTQLAQRSHATSQASITMRETNTALLADASKTSGQLQDANSSLEEISSMTRVNADHCAKASQIAREFLAELGQSEAAVNSLRTAMQDIEQKSAEVVAIAKAMDEIAFHTNLLALNAAVEAARAGEVGAGFAVVADEVRRLAQRSAESARETEELVQHSVLSSQRGVRFVKEVDVAISRVLGLAHEVANTAEQIDATSQEQRIGIDRIAQAMQVIDGLSQTSATRAEAGVKQASLLKENSESIAPLIQDLLAIVNARSEEPVGAR